MSKLTQRYSIASVLGIGALTVIGLLSAGIVIMQSQQKLEPVKPTILTVIPTPTSQSLIPDPRIKQLKESYGIELINQFCAAYCYNEPRNSMTLGEFIGKVGPPDKLASYLNTQQQMYFVDLFYFSMGLQVFASRPLGDNTIEMTPGMKVFRIDLWNSRTLSDLKREMHEVQKLDMPLEQAQDWGGFGPVQPLFR